MTIKNGACKPWDEKALELKREYDDAIEPLSKTGRDFELSYSVKTEGVEVHCIKEENIEDPSCGTICLFVTPPKSLQTTFGRAFFFLLDRSGSMAGE